MYEMRDDPRKMVHVAGKSINLALSERGRTALRSLGLEEEILQRHSIKMYGRMIHDPSGHCRPIPYGQGPHQYILSVSRRLLNEMLISEAEKSPNVRCHFRQKMVAADLERGVLSFSQQTGGKGKAGNSSGGGGHGGGGGDDSSSSSSTGSENASGTHESPELPVTTQATAHVVIGCDGAYSAIRRAMTKMLLLDYSQKYIEHGYLELVIPPTAAGEYAMPPNYLHIWPRGEFMMIALPNLDRSFTVTLFMPFTIYDEVGTEERLLAFFERHFADSIPLLTRSGLIASFFNAKPSPLISIKCKPYNYRDKVLLMGDAAHAMVPFYGQGMNCGFEDCSVLEELLAASGDSPDCQKLPSVLEKFTSERVANCHSIIDLAMYNYVEMRHLVNKRSFLVRKHLDNLLYRLLPAGTWVPLYTMVTFTRTPYRRCVEDRRWQDEALKTAGKVLLFALGLLLFVVLSKVLDEGAAGPALKRGPAFK